MKDYLPEPKYVYEKIQLEALPIESWRHLDYTAKRVNRLLWIKHHTPETREKLVLGFRSVSGRSVHTDIQYLIDIEFLKEENGKLYLTEKGNNYIEQAVKFIRDYLRRENSGFNKKTKTV